MTRKKPWRHGKPSRDKNFLGSSVQCPNWQCGGRLYLDGNFHEKENWKTPDIKCDNCGGVWRNSLYEQEKKP